jgi:TolB-like protein/Tfp pilus assembly protein PilF
MENATLSIAVLPFGNESDDPGQDYFARGFLDDLAIELSRFPNLEIIRPSTADEFKTGYLLRGAVRRLEDTIRVNVYLVEAGSGRQVWADRFDASAESLVAVQNEIVAQVAASLAVKIDNARLQLSRRKPIASLEVYDCWLRGSECLRRGTPEADAEARSFFERILELDPTYARGYAGMSLSHFNDWSCQAWEFWDDKERLAFDYARRAANLDDQDALIQLVLGRIFLYRRQFDEAARHVERAIELNPNDADVLVQAALCQAFLGEAEMSLSLAQKAMRLNVHHPDWYVAYAALPLFLLKRYSDAIAYMSRTPEATVDMPAYLAAACALSGDSSRASAYLKKFLSNFEEKIVFGRTPEPGEPLRWLQHVNPFRRSEDAALLEKGLRLTGLTADPDEGRAAALPVAATAQQGNASAVFRKNGDFWMLTFDGLTLQLTDVKGFHDLAELIARPHESIHCLDLAGRSADLKGNDAMLDDRARRELTDRVRWLQTEAEEASSHNDAGRAESARAELDHIVTTLSQAFGLAGRPRLLGSAVERARTAVTWRIRNAIRKTTSAHPGLGRHFENSVRTGTYCVYAPEKPVHWVV